MPNIKVTPGTRAKARLSLLAIGMVFFVSVIFFCSFYLVSTRQELINWFTALNNCFYDRAGWAANYFNPATKSQGNMFCCIALGICTCWLFYLVRGMRKKETNELVIHIPRTDILPTLICIASGIAAWYWGTTHALPAYDEVFSAQNVAGIHPFQAVAYYMMPNNHLLFNLANNVLFHWAADKVTTGRLISLFAYLALTIALFLWLKRVVANRWLAVLLAIALSLQFFTWGFSFQARGYELYLLAEWGMLLSLFGYVSTAKQFWLNANIACIVIGYFCLPSFLYFHVAQLLFMLFYCLFSRVLHIKFWKGQAVAFTLTFLCYLPTLCFSGISSVTGNIYVVPMAATTGAFWDHVYPYFTGYYHHVFSNVHFNGLNFDVVLLLLPLVLVFARRPYCLYGLFYLCLLLVFFLLTSVMKRLPFERNLIGHYSIALAGVLLLCHWMASRLHSTHARVAVVAIVAALFIAHFIMTNPILLKNTLYEHDVNDAYNSTANRLTIIPAGSTVACSDAEFYSSYICKKKGCIVSKCPSGNETYYLRQEYEPMPPGYEQKYILFNKTWGYEIYRIK